MSLFQNIISISKSVVVPEVVDNPPKIVDYDFSTLFKENNWDTGEICFVKILLWNFPELTSVFLAGGALRRPIVGQSAFDADFDFFFRSLDVYERMITFLENRLFVIKKKNNFNIQLERTIEFEGVPKTFRFQLIYPWAYNNAEDLINSFDYTLCQLALDFSNSRIYCGETTLEDIKNRQIKINPNMKLDKPVLAMNRIIKYSKQGFFANSKFMVEFLNLCKNLTIREEEVTYFQ